ncbi:MAG TPA: phosphoribosylaminoimidazolesuccinocarboxamide synthase [Chloroflexota bacterium]|nr:phosphoribosylaminoimidazolesuccinocarboxamide synthase [Chloroflexota bacterium]
MAEMRDEGATPVLDPRVPGLPLLYEGKVRNIHAVGEDRLLLLASDRLSAFDRVLPMGVPDKGRILTQLSTFWFRRTAHLVPNHLISASWPEIRRLAAIEEPLNELDGRATLVKRAERIDVECVVRGYLAGSGWLEYQARGTLAGLPLPPGLREGDALPGPAFTPAIKNDRGHDENISVEHLATRLGADLASQIETASRALYTDAHRYALTRGMIIADSKFEFGLWDGGLILIDEALTPDSSRFWDAARYRPGSAQVSFDKQPVRDYLTSLGWHGEAPAPDLPAEVIAATTARYHAAYSQITGKPLDE